MAGDVVERLELTDDVVGITHRFGWSLVINAIYVQVM
jgi:hypothetical protein